jgi:UDP-N-acetylmuramoylalanine--D-glutamate ligase
VRALGLTDTQIAAGLKTYPGLPHRMENVRTLRGVLYVNDSKATNPTSTAPALAAYPRIHWIAGGQAKGDDLDAVLPHLGHVAAAYLIGDAAPLFGKLLAGKLPVVQSGTLDAAVRAAAAAAKPGEVVLLSPACASFDQFSDFEARGRAFIASVESL